MLMTSHDSVMAAGGTTINATKVFAAADTRNTRLLVLRPGHGNAQDVAAVSAPDSVRAELWSDLALGQTLIVPARQVAVDGRPQIGWWRLDGASGELIAVMPGERGQGAAEYVTMAVNTLSYFQCITGIPREDSNGIKWGKWAVCTGGFVMGTYGVFVFEEDNLWGGILEIMGQGLMWGAQ
jgi:hypothetical protein